ncbi:MAG: replicative DNA helicase [Candidatus Omnitrophota bacterium]|nr:MAG: replicative DNA helicase [Candidatus Omnitrophota bacterium]
MAQESIEKMPPQSNEAEIAVLGSMLLEENAISQVIELLEENYFYNENHSQIFNAIISIYTKNKPVDLITVIEELKRNNTLEKVGGASYITGLTQAVPTAANVTHYAKIVRERYVIRSLITTCTQIASESYQGETGADELLDKAERQIFGIMTEKTDVSSVPVSEVIKDSIEEIDSMYQRKESIIGIPTGFHQFDIMTAGLQPSDLIIIAGRPSMGKSALATCIAQHVGVEEGMPTVMFSLEMAKRQLAQRMLCSHAKVDFQKVRTGFLSQSDWPKLTNAASKLSEAPIYIDDTPAISILELRAKSRRLKNQHDIRLIIVDYLQLMRGPSRSENRQQEISEISRSLKALARELNVPVIGISQLSRAVESRSDRRPQLSDLRESGAIEQDADVVLLLLREEYYNPTPENRGLAELIVAKQRNGPVGTLNLAFIKEYTRFENLAKRREVAEEEIEV